jgi:hypothetical protein
MNEIWKDIIGYEGYYQVSNIGNVRSVNRQYVDILNRKRLVKSKPLKQQLAFANYYKVDFKVNKIRKTITVHRLVAIAFLSNPENKPTVNHKDGNKCNNNVNNLEWATYSENNQHAVDILRRKSKWTGILGKDNPKSKTVIQYDKNNNKINEFAGTHEAERMTGISYKHISSCCLNKRKTTGGYIWKYK